MTIFFTSYCGFSLQSRLFRLLFFFLFQEDDGLRMRKSNVMSSQHTSIGMKKDEGLSARTMALIVLFFVVGVIVGKLVL